MFHPHYDNMTGHFQGFYESMGYIMVHGDADEHFLDYGYSKQNSKILHSHHKKCMPNSFQEPFFKSQRIQHESGALQTEFSIIYYFCRVLLTVLRILIGIWVRHVFYLSIFRKILLNLMGYNLTLPSLTTIIQIRKK